MAILWRPAMAIGDATIDTDHQKLIDLINMVEAILLESGERTQLKRVLDELSTYARLHFDREEGIMRLIHYVGLEHHQHAHRSLRSQLTELRASIESAALEALPPDELQRLVVLLRRWLVDHVFKEDMQLRPFLRQPN